jgi:Ala-tRNA(Pro) deacylase
MPNAKLVKFLTDSGVPYDCEEHVDTVTAQLTAEATHTKGKEMAKTVVMSLDGKPAMFVLPSPLLLNEDTVREQTGASDVRMVDEGEMSDLFPDCEVGAMPPFGNLYGMGVYVHEDLAEDDRIAFNAGTHHEIIRMKYEDFESLVNPTVGDYTH